MNAALLRRLWPALVCAGAGFVLFQFFGNATRGYIDTRSLFYWWGYQWFNAASETQHGPLVLLLAAWIAWRNLECRGEPRRNSSAVDGGAAMLAGVCLHLVGYAAQQSRISIIGLLVFAWGVLALGGGRRWARACLFPLGLLLLAVPVGFLDDVGFFLRLGVTRSAEVIVHAAGVGVIRSGTQLFAPDGRFQYDVAAACSGLRSLVTLVGLGLVFGYLMFRSFWLRATFAVLALPFAFAGNLVRILVIIGAGQRWGQSAGERVHAWSGLLVFILVLGLFLFTGRLLRRFFPSLRRPGCPARGHAAGCGTAPQGTPGERLPAPRAEEAGNGRLRWGMAAGVVAAVLGGAAATWQLDQLRPSPAAGVRLAEDGVDPVPLPAFVGTDWIGQATAVSEVERQLLPPDTGYSRRNYVSVADRERQVFFSIVLSGRDRTSIHRPELCLVGQGWSVLGRGTRAFELPDGGAVPATILRVRLEGRDPGGRAVSVPGLFAYWFVSPDAVVPSHADMILRSARDRLFHFRVNRWAYVVVQTTALDGEEEALARMEEIVAAVWPQVRQGPGNPASPR